MLIIRRFFLLGRRWVLAHFVPEWYWPRVISVDGALIKIRHTPYSFGTRWLLRTNRYENEERELIIPVLKPGMHVIEMGGSIGVLSAIIARHICQDGRLVSVEASAKLTDYSRSWLEKEGLVSVVTGYAFPLLHAPALRIKHFEEAAGSLGGRLDFDVEPSSAASNESCFDITTICSRYNLIPDVLVADVEGTELIMADHPPKFPDSIRYLMIELHKSLYPNGISDEKRIVQAIEQEGFRLNRHLSDVYLFSRD